MYQADAVRIRRAQFAFRREFTYLLICITVIYYFFICRSTQIEIIREDCKPAVNFEPINSTTSPATSIKTDKLSDRYNFYYLKKLDRCNQCLEKYGYAKFGVSCIRKFFDERPYTDTLYF